METIEIINYLTESQIALMQQKNVVKETEHLVGQLSDILYPLRNLPEIKENVKYTLETTDEVLGAVIFRLKEAIDISKEFHLVDSLIDSGYQEEIQRMTLDFENRVGIVERDEDGNLHCGTCMLPFKYCQHMEGKKVRLSLISLNFRHGTRNKYPAFAQHVDVIEEDEKKGT